MNRLTKGLSSLILSCTLLAGAALVPIQAYAAPLEVKVQVNDSLVVFPDAQPYINENERTLVPIRFVTEQLGYTVDWQKVGEEIHVTLTNSKHTISLITGQKEALIDGEQVSMGTTAEYEHGRVFVPLRFITETADIALDWEEASKLAILSADGASYAPDYMVFKATAYSADVSENGKYGARDYMGNSLQLGTVAVDPNVIPLGSKLYIEGYDFNGLPTGGMYANATDTGGAVKGNRLDIHVPGYTSKDLRKFGIQEIKVFILTP
jgi:3D (Asp-Asp-Asp) domain-containing protein